MESELLAQIRSESDNSIEGSLLRREALEMLLEEHYPWVSRLCLLEFSRSEAAFDCVQEIMLRITKSISNFRGDSALRTWMYTIAKRTIFEMKKKEQTYTYRFFSFLKVGKNDECGIENRVIETRLPETIYIKLEEHKELLDAIRQLPIKQRHAILLHYFEDMSVDNIAKQLDCSVGSVKTHLYRGREKLKVLLANLEVIH